MIYTILIILLSVAADQWTKHLAVTHLMGEAPFPVIPNILHFTYVENRGAAFGTLTEHRWVFMVFSTVAIVLIFLWLVRDKTLGPWFRCAAALIVGGGVGNMIDRIFAGYVVDFIDVVCIDFYVFNVADSCVSVGCVMFLVGVIVQEIREWRQKKQTADGPDLPADSAETATESADSAETAEIAESVETAEPAEPTESMSDSADSTSAPADSPAPEEEQP